VLDVFMAGDDAQAKASVSAFIKSLGLCIGTVDTLMTPRGPVEDPLR
jgi:predicted dinucleotide-binding enzyme